MGWTTARRSMRLRRCDGARACGRSIKAGEVYVESVIAPDHEDVGNEHWWRAALCIECADAYGHLHLIVERERRTVAL